MRNPYKIISLVLFLISASCSKDDDQCNCGSGTFQSTVDQSTSIETEIFVPAGSGPFPVIIIVPGSGLEPKEVEKPFADVFASIGFATVIYNKRGVGESSGSYPVEDIADPTVFFNARADDILAIIDALESRSDLNQDRIGLFSTSQGTWVSAIVFDNNPDLSQIVFASGGVAPSGMEYYYDTTMLNNPELTVAEGNDMLENFNGPPGYDPRALLSEMDFPVLFILGGQDRSHPTLWEIDFAESLNKSNIEIQYYPDSNHTLVDVTTGLMNENLIPQMLQWHANLQ